MNNRSQVINKAMKEFGAMNKYADSEVVRDLINHYKIPLVRALKILHTENNMSYAKLAKEVFGDEISRQAVENVYFKDKTGVNE